MPKKKILFLVSRFPYPLIKGDKLRAFHQIRYLSQDYDIHLCALSDEKVKKESIEELKKYSSEIKIFRLKPLTILWNILMSFLFSQKPMQVGYFYNKNIGKKLRQYHHDLNPDVVICQLIRTSEYARSWTGSLKIIDYMDALSAGMNRRSNTSKKWLSWLFAIEAKRLKKYEHNVINSFEKAMIISDADRQLIYHFNNDDIAVVPNGIDTDYFHKADKEVKYDLLFTGNMSYPPNIQAVQFLVKEVLPQVWETNPEVSLLICGANPHSSVKSLSEKRVTVQGWVDDIRDAYNSAKIFVAPMKIGSGLQNKILEAMSMQLPCLSSTLANNSLHAENGKEILLAETPEEYAKQILGLLDNKSLRQNLGEKGHSFVSKRYTWSQSYKTLRNLIENGRTEEEN